MANFFDQFDTTKKVEKTTNFFDRFDEAVKPVTPQPAPLTAVPTGSINPKTLLPITPQPSLEATQPKPVEKPVAAPVTNFAGFDEALARLTPKRTAPSVTQGVEGPGGAAFGMYPKQPMGGRTQSLSTETAASSPEILSVAATYLATRQPNKPIPDSPAKIMDTFRSSFVRGDFSKVDELTWALNASPDQKQLAAKAYELSSKLGTPLGEELRATFNPFESPTTYLSGGVGWGVKQAALRGVSTATKIALKAGMPSTIAAGVEAGVAAGTSAVTQKTKVELGLQEQFSYSQLAVETGLAAVTTKALGVSAGAGKLKTTEERMLDLEKARVKPMAEVDKANAEWLDKFKKQEATVKKELPALFGTVEEKAAARETMDTLSPQTDATKAVLNDDVINSIYTVTRQLFKDNPELRPDLNETRITQGMVNALDKASPEMIKDAAAKAGIDPIDFLETFKVTLSDAGAVMQKSKAMADYVNKLTGGDPELEKVVNRLYGSSTGVQRWSGKALGVVEKVTATSVATMVLAPSTTVLNAFSVAFSVALRTAGDVITEVGVNLPTKLIKAVKPKGVPIVDALDILEETVTTTGRVTNDLGGKVIPFPETRIKQEIGQSLADSISLVTKMVDGGFTAELTDVTLKNNPKLSNMLMHVGMEADMAGVPKILQSLNTLNTTLDAIVRAPVFVDSVSKRMKEMGLDYLDFVANKRQIPQAILQAAADDAMKLTMSYEFKSKKMLGETGFEAISEDIAFKVLDITRNNEIGRSLKSIGAPFLRYTMNAIRYAYRLTPISGVAGIQELGTATALRKEGKVIEASKYSYEGKQKMVDSAIGASAVAASWYYKDDSLPFLSYRNQDGDIKDASPLSPLVQVWALAAATKLMFDLTKARWYTLTMTPEERDAEAEIIKKKIDAMPANAEGRQTFVDDYELMKLNRLRNFDGAKFGEIMAGWGRASGIQETIVDKLTKAVEEGISESQERNAGGVVGDFGGRYDNALNPFFEMASAYSNDMRILDTKASSKIDESVSPFVAGALAPVLSQVPGARQMYPAKPSLFQPGEQKVPTVTRQLLGVKPEMPTGAVENELVRLGVKPFAVYKSSGNRDFDNLHISLSRSLVKAAAEEEMNSPLYKQGSMNQQKELLNKAIQGALTDTKEAAQDIYMKKSPKKAVDLLYEKLPQTTRQSAEDEFMKKFNRRPETSQEKMLIIEGEFNFNKGGLATQMQAAMYRP